MEKAAPFPVFGAFTQCLLYWIAMNIDHFPVAVFHPISTPCLRLYGRRRQASFHDLHLQENDPTQLLHKLPVISDVEVVITLLPEMLGLADESAQYALLQ